DLNGAKQIHQLHQSFQPDGHIAVDIQAKLVVDQLGQSAVIVVAIGALGAGDVVDLIVVRDIIVGGDHDVAGDLQHADFVVDKVQLHIHDHVGVAVVGLAVVGGTGGHVAALGAAVDAQHQDVQLFAVQALRGVQQLADGQVASALRPDGVQDHRDRAGKDQRNGQHGAQQDLPPQALFLAFALFALAVSAVTGAA